MGDEYQLPPYVEQEDEHFIHALSAIHRSEKGNLGLEEAVNELGELWQEDEELHKFRNKSVLTFCDRTEGFLVYGKMFIKPPTHPV